MNFAQLKAIVWLRWRLTRNQFSRGGRLNAWLSVLFLLLMLGIGTVLAIGGVALGIAIGKKASGLELLLTWDGVFLFFLLFWTSGLLVEIQRSEMIDLTRLLHLPVTLQQVFTLNYLASHLTPSIVALMPGMLGLCLGLALGGGPAMALTTLPVLAVVFAITSWTYCLRGWLAALMQVKRRRRAIMAWFTLIIVALAQAPQILVHSRAFEQWQAEHRDRTHATRDAGLPDAVVEAHAIVPLGWPGYAAMRLKQGRPWPALAFAAMAALIGVLGLARAYQLTIRFHRGVEALVSSPAGAAGAGPPHVARRGPFLVERRLPWLPDDTAALALATFRSLTRAPELRMALIMPVILLVVFLSAGFGLHRAPRSPNDTFGYFASTGVIAMVALALAPTMSNVFGLDRDAFRGIVLLPVEREKVLFARNLAFSPFAAGTTFLGLLITKWTVPLSWEAFAIGLVQWPTAFMLFSAICNYFSILAPYRLAEGTLKAQKPKPVVLAAAFVATMLSPLFMAPILIPPGLEALFSGMHWLPWLPVGPLAALAILAGTAWLYFSLLPAQGRLLHRREQTVLREVTAEIE
jgi:hypothetical protein